VDYNSDTVKYPQADNSGKIYFYDGKCQRIRYISKLDDAELSAEVARREKQAKLDADTKYEADERARRAEHDDKARRLAADKKSKIENAQTAAAQAEKDLVTYYKEKAAAEESARQAAEREKANTYKFTFPENPDVQITIKYPYSHYVFDDTDNSDGYLMDTYQIFLTRETQVSFNSSITLYYFNGNKQLSSGTYISAASLNGAIWYINKSTQVFFEEWESRFSGYIDGSMPFSRAYKWGEGRLKYKS
jgi:hypothetical protein